MVPLFLRRAQAAGRNPEPVEVENLWGYGERLVCKLAGVDTIEAAADLCGSELLIRGEDRPPAKEGEFYLAELAGCTVMDAGNGQCLGTVRGWQEAGGAVLLEVDSAAGGELLIPFAAAICVRVAPAAKRIDVVLPPGLMELNRSGGESS